MILMRVSRQVVSHGAKRIGLALLALWRCSLSLKTSDLGCALQWSNMYSTDLLAGTHRRRHLVEI